ncbi:hypothetical protein MCAV_08030 [[Mycoplasma] cavipharyngis]|uniref:hypothetical protein n=1 Tax=[Mycoplasma] cavipharyngis TaxID=92757 RepID=UPI00370410A6
MSIRIKKVEDDYIAEDSLDAAIHEVSHKTDLELANLFLTHNNDAIHNPEATFTNIETDLEEVINAQGLITKIDDELKQKTLAEIKNKRIVFKQLLVEDYRKKWFQQKWKQITKIFSLENHPQVYRSRFNYQLETDNWKSYDQIRVKTNRQKEIKNSDFLTYTDLQLRDQQGFRRIWKIETFISLIMLFLATGFIAILSLVPQAYIITSNASFANNIANLRTASYTFATLAIIFLILPYFFLFTTWFVAINGANRSRNFHYFMVIFLAFAAIFVLIDVGLIIAYYSYSFPVWFS